MSYSDDYETRRQERREEERRYQSDVNYEVWRAGGNPDRINEERVQDAHNRGAFVDEAASIEIRKQRHAPQDEEEQFPEEQQ